jgi:predicted Fe-S protein YdhL (DUF1289 family)
MINSPCIKVCRLTDCKAFCVGCWRTLEEIKGWRHYNEAEKQSVLDMIENRKKHYTIKEKQ